MAEPAPELPKGGPVLDKYMVEGVTCPACRGKEVGIYQSLLPLRIMVKKTLDGPVYQTRPAGRYLVGPKCHKAQWSMLNAQPQTKYPKHPAYER